MVDLSPPANPNGVIIKNIVYVNHTIANITTDESSQVLLTGLAPYTLYTVHIAACTKVGCTNSSGVLFRTLQDGESDLFVCFITNVIRQVTQFVENTKQRKHVSLVIVVSFD